MAFCCDQATESVQVCVTDRYYRNAVLSDTAFVDMSLFMKRKESLDSYNLCVVTATGQYTTRCLTGNRKREFKIEFRSDTQIVNYLHLEYFRALGVGQVLFSVICHHFYQPHALQNRFMTLFSVVDMHKKHLLNHYERYQSPDTHQSKYSTHVSRCDHLPNGTKKPLPLHRRTPIKRAIKNTACLTFTI